MNKTIEILKGMVELYEDMGIEDSDSGEDKDHAIVEQARGLIFADATRKKRVFVSGPYTKGDPVVNVRNAIFCANDLLNLGYSPFCPHLSHLWHTVVPRTWEDWMDLDLEWITACDALLRLPGESKGADIEVARAIELGIPVFNSIEELIKNVKP